MDVEISLHDFKFQRPNRGLSTLIKSSNTFLNIIYNERLILKLEIWLYEYTNENRDLKCRSYR
jgi:hypothetical protein